MATTFFLSEADARDYRKARQEVDVLHRIQRGEISLSQYEGCTGHTGICAREDFIQRYGVSRRKCNWVSPDIYLPTRDQPYPLNQLVFNIMVTQGLHLQSQEAQSLLQEFHTRWRHLPPIMNYPPGIVLTQDEWSLGRDYWEGAARQRHTRFVNNIRVELMFSQWFFALHARFYADFLRGQLRRREQEWDDAQLAPRPQWKYYNLLTPPAEGVVPKASRYWATE